jgi:hypothetical protein
MDLKRSWLSGVLCVAVAGLGAAACGGEPTPAAEEGTAAVTEGQTEIGTVASAAMTALLEKADAADGTTDKVVSNCVTCGLKMAGSADNAAKVGDYEIHLCSANCLGSFNEDPEKALAALDLP